MVRSDAIMRRRGCGFGGDLALPDGVRWFMYVSFTGAEGELGTWLPVEVADGSQMSATRVLYQPPARSGGATQMVAGAARGRRCPARRLPARPGGPRRVVAIADALRDNCHSRMRASRVLAGTRWV